MGRALVAAVLVLGAARVGVAPAERCPTVTVEDVRTTTAAAVGWLAANQQQDGRWTYRMDESGRDLGGYSDVRHAGVLLSLEQAADAGIAVAEAAESAERGLAWARRELVRTGEGARALAADGDARTGASALLVRALLQRGDPDDDRLLQDLGRFLVGQVLPSGAVSAVWSASERAPVPEARDRFFTGETLWALVGLAARFPDEPSFTSTAALVGRYLPTSDDAEDRFPPTSDHWASYAYGDLAGDMTAQQRSHAARLGGIFGVEVRTEATRWRGGLQRLVRGGPAVGSGLGTLGEGSAALLRALGPDCAGEGLAERVRCVAGMLVDRQSGGDDRRTAGAWFTRGTTRMDDQQHAISALVAATDVMAAGGESVGGGERRHSVVWLALASVLVVNPWRPGTVRRSRVAAVAGAATLAIVLSGPVLDALDVSPASARTAAGAAVLLAAVASVVRPAVGSGVVAGALAIVAIAIGADDGLRAVPFAVLSGVLVGIVPARWRVEAAARALAAASVLVGVDLVVDGVMGV